MFTHQKCRRFQLCENGDKTEARLWNSSSASSNSWRVGRENSAGAPESKEFLRRQSELVATFRRTVGGGGVKLVQ